MTFRGLRSPIAVFIASRTTTSFGNPARDGTKVIVRAPERVGFICMEPAVAPIARPVFSPASRSFFPGPNLCP